MCPFGLIYFCLFVVCRQIKDDRFQGFFLKISFKCLSVVKEFKR